MHASDETSLATTASHFTAAEVASAPTAEQVAEVAAEPLSFAGVAETQSVDVTAAAEAARHASVETALAATAGQIWLRLRLLRLQPPRNSRKQQRALSSVKEVLVESIPMPEAQSAYCQGHHHDVPHCDLVPRYWGVPRNKC